MSLSIEQLVEESTGLVSLPAVAVRLNAMVNDPDSTAADIGRLISQDPALTIRLLQLANSPFFGLSHRVETISRAVTVIGTSQIRDLVLATSVGQAFERIPNELMSMEAFWRHSVYCGLIARMLAEDLNLRHSESMFIAGLLHDIGRLLVFNREPDEAHKAFLLSLQNVSTLPPHEAERRILGHDHAQVGGALAARLNLPRKLQDCIRYHHEPASPTDYPVEVALVHIANSVAHMAELDTQDPGDVPPIDPRAWERVGLEPDVVRSLIERAQQQVVDVESLVLHHP
ncbi:HDOD domain-containing protein [Ectothiorhodospira lacustris]|uniref:HDOD domain-containing protein n=1 Tax=Ectothiorhodospira lacustris TaxID=2899127 RepID=UPI001EE95393|nr:HDOD domain-containing protein [Ectothiorhodospira lacustris]MCG5500750.1 HDOD domain-containing protein [Ectothiorhodospira lacustris]MCG5510886.1 HDOD domain-containing protein [Ectothiorhodospira lacustris]MCG5522568.1 HDOD domain-containing protein [Ectothiorhodospira lacustris]